MSFVVSIASVCPMRKEPSHRSEMVSQLLFGEFAGVVEKQKDFTRVRCLYDGYEGWCQSSQLEFADSSMETVQFLLTLTDSVLVGEDTSIPIHFGSPVYGGADDEISFGTRPVYYTVGDKKIWNAATEVCDPAQIRSVAENYLGTSYLWGGKSVFGIDCSGFVQQVYKFFGVRLLRDAYLQAEQGEAVFYNDIQFGDLAFFKNENDRITHVGLMLDGYQIIHASGRVRIDELRTDGIYSSETGDRSHVLHSIRRVSFHA
jgi:gamma-D-glutamyl-L-lysine dipeptidyl-peptidase